MQDWLDCRLSDEAVVLRSPQRVRKPAPERFGTRAWPRRRSRPVPLAPSVRSERIFILLCVVWLGLTLLTSLIFIPISLLTDARFVEMSGDLRSRTYDMTVMSGLRERSCRAASMTLPVCFCVPAGVRRPGRAISPTVHFSCAGIRNGAIP